MSILIIILAVIGVLVLYVLGVYNKFVTTKTRIKASIQEIGNQLKRQADLIPNLIESVRGFMKHEKSIFTDLTNARKTVLGASDSGDAQKMINASTKLQQALGALRVVVESTPQIQAAGPTTQLMEELRDTTDKVMYARRTLIDLTADYNIMVVTVPASIIASIFGFTELPGLKMPEGTEGELSVKKEEMKTPKVDLN